MSLKHSTPLNTKRNNSTMSRYQSPLAEGRENKKHEINKTLSRARFWQSAYLLAKTKQVDKLQEKNAIAQATLLWEENTRLKQRHCFLSKSVESLKLINTHSKLVESQESFLKKYLEVREQLDLECGLLADEIKLKKFYIKLNSLGIDEEQMRAVASSEPRLSAASEKMVQDFAKISELIAQISNDEESIEVDKKQLKMFHSVGKTLIEKLERYKNYEKFLEE